jgi:peptidoglycan/LPS O-acetylase OafA/YrhL
MALLVAVAAGAVIHLAVFGERGDMIGGWSLDAAGIQIGLARVMFPFFAGVLLMRLGKRIRIEEAFTLCSFLLVAALSVPRLGGGDQKWINGIYEAACIIVLFPLIVAIGAGVKQTSGRTLGIASFFGDLSYPLYITHFPLIYIYTGWVVDAKIPPAQGAVVGAAVFAATIAIAYAALRFYDLPVRRWLTKATR